MTISYRYADAGGVKIFYREAGRIRLQPANPAMQPMLFDPSQIQIQGVVVGVMRRY